VKKLPNEDTSTEAKKEIKGIGGSKTLKILLAVFVLVILAGGGFLVAQEFSKKSDESGKEDKEASSSASSAKESKETTAADEYAGCWNTYTNNEVGYTLKYPCDWTVKEVNEFSETISANVKYITITTPDSNYFVHFGVRKNGVDSFETTDRTGVGAGEFVELPAETVMIFGVSVTPKKLVFEGKTKEYFYNQPTGSEATAGCDFVAGFSYTASADYATYDMTGLGYVTTVKLILQSAELI